MWHSGTHFSVSFRQFPVGLRSASNSTWFFYHCSIAVPASVRAVLVWTSDKFWAHACKIGVRVCRSTSLCTVFSAWFWTYLVLHSKNSFTQQPLLLVKTQKLIFLHLKHIPISNGSFPWHFLFEAYILKASFSPKLCVQTCSVHSYTYIHSLSCLQVTILEPNRPYPC
jgi:hypothetical protein